MTDSADLALLGQALRVLEDGLGTPLRSLPSDPAEQMALEQALLEAARRLGETEPYPHPLYAGHMLKPPHAAARLGYMLALGLNPNNHAFDGGCASSRMEIEAVEQIAAMFGWSGAVGHLCSGGTVANLEALWIARQAVRERHGPDAAEAGVAASAQAHYCHARAASLLGQPFTVVPADSDGRMDVDAVAALLRGGSVGTVVATLGTSAGGAVDPLDLIADLCAEHGAHLHVDAAYGGYFTLADDLPAHVRRAFDAVARADSFVVDPHKHGLQPYGCGCVVLRDPALQRHYAHTADYAYQSTDDPHLGRIALECSRPGASAVALWTTLQVRPLLRGGAFARDLTASRQAAAGLWSALRRDRRFVPLAAPDLDVVTWAVRAPTVRLASARARLLHAAAQRLGLHVSLAEVPATMAGAHGFAGTADADRLLVLRACLMKPEHLDWLERLVAVLDAAARELPGMADAFAAAAAGRMNGAQYRPQEDCHDLERAAGPRAGLFA